MTSVLSKVFERLVSVRLRRFMERRGLERSGLTTTQFPYRRGLGTCDTFLRMSHTLRSALESGQRLGSSRFISAQPLIGSTIREFSISSVRWVLEVLRCLY